MKIPFKRPAGVSDTEGEEEEEEESESEEMDRPPRQFLQDARSLNPNAEQIQFFRAWAASKHVTGSNGIYNPEGARETAALSLCLDNEDILDNNEVLQLDLPLPIPKPVAPKAEQKKLVQPIYDRYHSGPRAAPLASGSKHRSQLLHASDVRQKKPAQPILKPLMKPILKPKREERLRDAGGVRGKALFRKELRLSSGMEIDEDSDIEILDRSAEVFRDVMAAKAKVKPLASPVKVRFASPPAEENPAPPVQPNLNLVPTPVEQLPPQLTVSHRLPHELTSTETAAALESILQIVIDVDPSHVLSLLKNSLMAGKIELVLERLFSGDYPKVKSEVKKVRVEERKEEKKKEEIVDYYNVVGRQNMGPAYREMAIAHLSDEFRTMPVSFIKSTFKASSSFYACAHLALEKARATEQGYRKLGAPRSIGKGKGRADPEVEKEKLWIIEQKEQASAAKAVEAARELKVVADRGAGLMVECGCCYGDFCFDELIQCTEAHLFCKECSLSNANNQIGLRNFILPCMSGEEGCVFTENECAKFLPATSIALLQKIRQEREVDLAELDDLVKCPFCPYACVIDNVQERLFRCMREGCEIVSCRECRKPDHLPKTCQEMDADRVVDARHIVEEAMSLASIRKCPKCSNPYTKSEGCNKIVCSVCSTPSCFICGQIVAGYQHFANAGTNGPGSEPGATCDLWDRQPGERDYRKVEAARVEAAAKVADQVSLEDLENLKMVAPPAAPAHLAHLPGIAFNDYAGNLAANNLARLDPARQLAEQQRVNLLHQRANQQAMAEHAVRLQALQAARLADAARDERAFRKRVAADAKAEEARAAKRARLLQ